MGKTNEPENSSINLLGSGTQIKGEIVSNGDFRIEGTLEGNITLKGKLVLGPTGKIEGNITCQNADFSGTVLGNVKVRELLILQNTSKIIGDIWISKLSIEPGAAFTGKCTMGEEQKMPNKEQPELPKIKPEEPEEELKLIPTNSPVSQKPNQEKEKKIEKNTKFPFSNKNERRG